MQPSNKSVKYYRLLKIVLIVLLCLDFIKNSYTFLYWVPQGGVPPMYLEWIKYSLLDFLIIFLLLNKKLTFFGLLLLIFTIIYGLSFLFETGAANPLMWITHYQSFSMASMIVLWWIALVLSFVGIFLWWKLRKINANQCTVDTSTRLH